MSKLWGGRFGKGTDPEVERYTSSLALDLRLAAADLAASRAHARMLGATGVLPPAEAAALVEGLTALAADWERGGAELDPAAEDVHSEIERLLRERLGSVAGKLHTGRSRNDQVATATRLYLRGQIDALDRDLRALQAALLEAARPHTRTLMPGTTHLQHAQPVSLAHHLLAYFWMFERDRDRLRECRARVNRLPLGAAALAGTSYPLDRAAVARELGFDEVVPNSLDAVSDRDFVVEFLAAGSLVMIHLSRWCEELVLWSTPEFGFVELDESVTTGSSIMPQKKNPDVAELVRGRAGRLTGDLIGALTMLKGLPLSYNRDLQEDKHHLFDGLDTVRSSVRMGLKLVRGAEFRTERMRAALAADFSNATDLADLMVGEGIPFRQAHEITGRIVRDCLERERALEDLSAEDWREVLATHAALGKMDPVRVREALQPEAVLSARRTEGGAGPEAVAAQLALAEAALDGADSIRRHV